MRRALLVTVLLLSGCDGQPPQTKTVTEIEQLIKLTDKTVSVVQKSSAGAPAAELHAALREMADALKAISLQLSSTESRLNKPDRPRTAGAVDPVRLSACFNAHISSSVAIGEQMLTTSTPDIEQFQAGYWAAWLSSAVECISHAKTYLNRISDKRAADEVGVALSVLYPAILAVHAKLGLTDADFYRADIDNYHSANEHIIAKLAPKCRESRVKVDSQIVEVRYECVAHDGEKARGIEVYKQSRLVSAPVDRMLINAQATRLTSRGVAMAAQPKLEALIRAMANRDRKS